MLSRRLKRSSSTLAAALITAASAGGLTALQPPDDACPALVNQAVERVSGVCAELQRNQMCYGNMLIELDPDADADIDFEQPGDRVRIEDVAHFHTLPLNVETQAWGIAVLKVQANLPETLPGQNVTIIAFGDTDITDAAETDEVVDPDTLNPMQAFYFRSSLGEPACVEAPDSGVLIQTPQGAGMVELTVNGVTIALGSTAYVVAEPEGLMDVFVVEGQAELTAQGATAAVPAGAHVTVPLDGDLNASGPPADPEPYNLDDLRALPISLLPEHIEIAEPVDDEALIPFRIRRSGVSVSLGMWNAEITAAAASEGCGPMLHERYSTAAYPLPLGSFEIGAADISTPADFVRHILSMGEENPNAEITFTTESANLFIGEQSYDGTTSMLEVRVISPERIEVDSTDNLGTTPEFGTCIITMTVVYTYGG